MTKDKIREEWQHTEWSSPTPGLHARRLPGGRLYPEARVYDDYHDGVILEVTLYPAGRRVEGVQRRLFKDGFNTVDEAKAFAEAFAAEQLG